MLNTGKLAGKVIYISGASRGIGKAIALKAAKDGARVVVAAKTTEPHPKLPGTIYTAAEEIEAAGGQAFPCVVDIRNEEQIQKSIEETVEKFGGIDILINNASAINLTGTQETPMKKFDLMHQINTRGTYLVTKLALPYLKASKNNPHVLNISPPLNMNPRWFRDHVGYTMAKYGMSMCVLGMSEEFKPDNIAVNALWPKTAIITAAMEMLGGAGASAQCRTPEIMADAAYIMLTRDSRSFTGNFSIDEDILKEEGCRDFSQYLAVPGTPEKDLIPDFFLDELDDPSQVTGAAKGTSKPRFVGGVDTAKSDAPAAGGGEKTIQSIFDKLASMMNEELIKKVQAVYTFKVKGADEGVWHMDLKNAPGSSGIGEPKASPDVTFSLSDADFHKLFEGKLNPTSAFMSGKLKMEGNLGKAMALEKVMKKMNTRGYHTSTSHRHHPIITNNNNNLNDFAYHNVIFSRKYSDAPPATYSSVPQVFERIKAVANADMVSKVKACYIFEVEGGEGKYYIDLKEGEGQVGEGEIPNKAADFKPEVKITMSQENMLKMFNRELAPATAFMTGKLKLSGDLSKALALETVLKTAREQAAKQGFHTSATQLAEAPPALYDNVPQVFERIKSVANADMVEKVKACYIFQVDGNDTKYYIDLKEGEGQVGEGDIPNRPADFKPEVRITMSEENMLKMFNRELAPATAFMTGKLKLSGDLSKALALEAILKAAREKAEAQGGKRSYHTSATEKRDFHTSTTQLKFDLYETVPEVRERMAELATKRLCKDVKAVYFFDMQDDETFYVDWKNGSGSVGVGEPPIDKKPDVTFTLRKEWLMKVLNREVTPASTFMSGKVKVMGDLSKALKLEEILRAAREADERKAAKNG